MSDLVLEIDGLTCGYDEAAVVRDLDLTIGAGEIVALLGANGRARRRRCGRSPASSTP